MQRRLNLRLLLWTVGCLTIIAIGVNVLHAYQLRRNAHVLLERSELALDKHEVASAIVYLSQYLALAPHDIDALEKFAVTLDKTARDPGEQVRVVLRLEDLLMRDAERHDARKRLIDNLMALRRYQDAIVHLQFLLPRRPGDAALHYLLGRCQAANGESAAAVAALWRCLEHDPARIDAYLLLAEIHERRLAKEDEAGQIIDRMVQANPKNPDAYLARSRFARQRGQTTEAAQDLQHAVALAPDNAAVLLAAAAWAEDQARPDEARQHLRHALQHGAANAELIKALANLELRNNRPAAATQILRDGIVKASEAYELHVLLADLLIDTGQHDEATRVIETLVRAGLPPAFPNYLQARLAVERRQWMSAIDLLEKVRVDLGTQTAWSSRVHALLGACYEQLGDNDQRLAAWQRAVQIEPGWTAAKHALGTALLACGRVEEGVAELGKAVELGDRQPQMLRRLVELLLERRQFEQVEQVLLVCEQQAPLSPDLARQAAEAAAANKNTVRVRQLVAQLFPAPPRDARELVWLASLHARIDEPTKAEVWLRKAVQRAEHIPETWIALVEHLARTGQHPAAATAIAEGQRKMPEQRRSFTVARCWDAAGDPARAAAAYAEALTERPDDFLLLAAAADFHWRGERAEFAAPLYQRLLDPQAAAPLDLQAAARRQLALCRVVAGQATEALSLLDANRQAFGEQSTDQRIRWYLEGQQTARRRHAILQLKESFSRFPSSAEEELLLIQLEELGDDAGRARDRLAQLLNAHETPHLIARHIRLLVKTEALDEALLWLVKLQRWEPINPRSQELQKLVLTAKEKV